MSNWRDYLNNNDEENKKASGKTSGLSYKDFINEDTFNSYLNQRKAEKQYPQKTTYIPIETSGTKTAPILPTPDSKSMLENSLLNNVKGLNIAPKVPTINNPVQPIQDVPQDYNSMLQDTGTNMVRGVNINNKKVVTGTDYAWTKDTLMSGFAQSDTGIFNALRMVHKAASKATDLITPDWLYDPKKDLANKALDKTVDYYDKTAQDYKKGHDYTGIRGYLGGALEALPASTTAFMGLSAFGTIAGGNYSREAENEMKQNKDIVNKLTENQTKINSILGNENLDITPESRYELSKQLNETNKELETRKKRIAPNENIEFLQQLAYGVIGGLAEGITEKAPFEHMEKVIKGKLIDEGAKTLRAKYGKVGLEAFLGMVTEFVQEAAVDPITDFAKKEFYQNDMKMTGDGGVVDGKKMFQDGLGGIAMSVLMMGLGLPSHAASHIIASKAIENKAKLDDKGLKDLATHEVQDIANLTPEEQKQYTASEIPKVDINALPQMVKDKVNPIPTGTKLSTVAPLEQDKSPNLLELPNFLKNKDSYSAINKLPQLKTESVKTEPQVKEESVNSEIDVLIKQKEELTKKMNEASDKGDYDTFDEYSNEIDVINNKIKNIKFNASKNGTVETKPSAIPETKAKGKKSHKGIGELHDDVVNSLINDKKITSLLDDVDGNEAELLKLTKKVFDEVSKDYVGSDKIDFEAMSTDNVLKSYYKKAKTKISGNTNETKPKEETTIKSKFNVSKTKDTRDNSDLWVIKINDKVSSEEYKKIADDLKKLGGSKYSRYTKGFNFKFDPTEKLKGYEGIKDIAPGKTNELENTNIHDMSGKGDIETGFKYDVKDDKGNTHTFGSYVPEAIVNMNDKDTKPESKVSELNLGKSGKAAFKKWGENEYVNADLSKPDDEYTKAWTKFFNYWYNKGLNGEQKHFTDHIDTGEDFAPFLESRAYEAGQKDRENNTKPSVIPESKGKNTVNKKYKKHNPEDFKIGDYVKVVRGKYKTEKILKIKEFDNKIGTGGTALLYDENDKMQGAASRKALSENYAIVNDEVTKPENKVPETKAEEKEPELSVNGLKVGESIVYKTTNATYKVKNVNLDTAEVTFEVSGSSDDGTKTFPFTHAYKLIKTIREENARIDGVKNEPIPNHIKNSFTSGTKADIKEETKPADKKETSTVPIKNRLSKLDQMAEEAKKRLEARHKTGKTLYAGLPMDDLVDYSIIGAAKLAHKAMDIAEFTKAMVAEHGDNIRLFIGGIYGQSQAMLEMSEEDINKMIELASKEETNTDDKNKIDNKPIEYMQYNKIEAPKGKPLGYAICTLDNSGTYVKEYAEYKGKAYALVIDERSGDLTGIPADKVSSIEDFNKENPGIEITKEDVIKYLKGNGLDIEKILNKEGENNDKTSNAGNTSTRSNSGYATDNNGKDKSEDVPQNEKPGNTGKLPTEDGKSNSGKENKNGGKPKEEQSTTGGSNLSGNNELQPNDSKDGVGDNKRGTVPGDSTVAIGNHRIDIKDLAYEGGIKTRYKQNVEAIKLLKKLEAEDRPATSEEQKILAKFIGWGGMKGAFNIYTEDSKQWIKEREELKALLTKEEFEAASKSTMNAHYTAPNVIVKMYQALEKMGFKKGTILESSMGIGNFFGLLPGSMSKSKLIGVELDSLTGRMAQKLYPKADIRITGFQNAVLPNDYMDIVVGNVPFADIVMKEDKDFRKYNFNLHDYFIAKSVQKLRAGGIIAVITSKGTMDKRNNNLRKYLSDKVELLGAIRLPDTAFQKNANTQVTTDILFLRKLEVNEAPKGEAWENLGAIKLPKDKQFYDYRNSRDVTSIPVNEYYIKHPEMLLGEMVYDKGQYGNESETSLVLKEGTNLDKLLEKAINKLPENVYKERETTKRPVEKPTFATEEDNGVKDNSYVIKDGELVQRKGIEFKKVRKGKYIDPERIKGLIKIRDSAKAILEAQKQKVDDKTLAKLQKELNKVYDEFVKKHGLISDKANKATFDSDPDYYLLQSLEKVNKKTGKVEKGDIFFKRTARLDNAPKNVDNAKDGLPIVLNEKGYLDLDRIAELSGKTKEEVIKELKGLIYLNPNNQSYETADEYLSGNVREKLREARAAAELDSKYKENIEALENVQPKDLDPYDIKPVLAASWIPKDVYRDFIAHLFKIDDYYKDGIKLTYNAHSSKWGLDTSALSPNSYNRNALINTWGTNYIDGLDLVEKGLNMQSPTIYYPKEQDGSGGGKNKRETELANAKLEAIKNEFKKWIYADNARRDRLAQIYNETFNSNRNRSFDGSYLTFHGMNKEYTLMKHQKDSIARIIQGGNTLLAKCVGAGKTFIMQGASMELKRLGLSHKPLHVIKNDMVESGQYAKEFYELYPGANLLIATSEDFGKKNRKALFARIATGNYDAIIIGHSSFKLIGLSKEAQMEFINEQIKELEEAILSANEDEASNGKKKSGSKIVTELEKAKERLKQQLKELMDIPKDDVVTFEEMGIDSLFIDEAHNFKKLPIYTKLSRIAGIHTKKSQMATDLYMKTRYINKLNGGERNVVFASGTPISNSMTEMYVMQKYLQPETLKAAGLQAFDSWASSFGEVVNGVEGSPTGKGFRLKQRFAKFVNAPELVSMFQQIADVFTLDMLKKEVKLDIPTLTGGEKEGQPIRVISEATDDQNEYIDWLIERQEDLQAQNPQTVRDIEDNYLRITTEGRKIALDQRLMIEGAEDNPNSKLNQAVNNIFQEWKAGNKDKTTQIVFCDLGVPSDDKKKTNEEVKPKTEEEEEEEVSQGDLLDVVVGGTKFNVYQEIKDKLMQLGVPKDEIAFIHDAGKDKDKKAQILADFRSGKIRVLIGNTSKMGEGTNMQDRVIALHHLDCPFRPSDVEQREGRMIRQGNINSKVKVYRYATKGTFDSYMWQMIERKAKFIGQVMKGEVTARDVEDIDEVVMNAAVMKAASADNPLIMEKVQVDSEVQKLQGLETSHNKNKYIIETDLKRFKNKANDTERDIKDIEKDIEHRNKNLDKENFSIKIDGKTYTDKKEAGEVILNLLKPLDKGDVANLGEYGGFKLRGHLYKIYAGEMKENEKGEAELQTLTRSYTLTLENNTHLSTVDVDNPNGVVTRLNNMLEGLDEKLENYKKGLETSKQNVADLEKELKKPFEHREELDKLLKRKEELDSILNINKKEGEEGTEGSIEHKPRERKANKYRDSNNKISPSYSGTLHDIQARVQANGSEEDNDYSRNTGLNTKPYINGTETNVKSRIEMLGNLQKQLNVPFRTGRIPGSKAILGVFKRNAEVIRTRTAEDFDVIAHEVGHHLDKMLGIREDIRNKRELHGELRKLGKDQSKDEAKQLHEGIAEFVRLYLTDNEKAKDEAPNFYDYFEYLAKSDKQVYKALETFKNDYEKYSTASAEARVRAGISVTKEKTIIDNAKEIFNFDIKKTYTQWIDELNPVNDLVKEVNGKKPLSILKNPALQAWLFRGWQSKAIGAIEFGIRDKNNVLISKSLESILKPVKKHRKEFTDYITMKRALELDDRGIETGFTREDIKAVLKKHSSNKVFETAFNEIQQYNAALFKKLVESGIMSEEQAESIQEFNKDYVPLYRVMDSDGKSGGTGKTFANLASPVKKIKGSGRTVIDPLESIVKNTYYYINMAERNNVGKTLVDFINSEQGNGNLVEKVAPKFKATSFQVAEVQKALEGYGADLSKVGNLEEVLTVFRPLIEPSAKDNIVTIFRDGKKEMYQLDKDIYEAILFLNTESATWFTKLASKSAAMLRAGAVLDPNFIGRNPIRDMFSAMVYSKYGYIPVLDTLIGLKHVVSKDETYKSWVTNGGKGAAMVSLDRDYLAGDVRKIMNSGDMKAILKDVVNHPVRTLLEPLRAISESLEEATRVIEFSKGVKKEGNTQEGIQKSILASRDLTVDFARAGTIGKSVNRYNAFFNATLQGTDKMLREFKTHPFKTMLLVHLYISLPSIILWFLFHDDDKIKNLPPWRKDLCWNIPTENHIISIPKPFELGIIFGSGYERALDYLYDKDKYAFGEWSKSFVEGITPPIMPTVAVPLIEAAANYSFFRKSPIENMGDSGLDPQDRYNAYTSETAKKLGRLPMLVGASGISPKKIDNTISGYTGGLGKLGVAAADKLMGGKDKVSSTGIENIPGLKAFLSTPYSSPRTVDYFYKDLSSLEAKYKGAVRNYRLANDMTSDEYTKYASKHKSFIPDGISEKDYHNLMVMRDVKSDLDKLKQEEDTIMNSTKYTPEQKKTISQKADKMRIDLIKEIYGKK